LTLSGKTNQVSKIKEMNDCCLFVTIFKGINFLISINSLTHLLMH